MSQFAVQEPETLDISMVLDALMGRARAAMATFADADQARIDEAVTALAWAIYKPENAERLAGLAVEDTQVGMWPIQPGIDQVGHGSSPWPSLRN